MPAKRTEPEKVPEAEPDDAEPEKPKLASSSSSTTARRPLGRLLAPSEMVPVKKVKVSQPVEETPSPIAAPPAEASAIGPYPPPDDGGYSDYLPEPEEYMPAQEPHFVQQQSLPNVAPPPGVRLIDSSVKFLANLCSSLVASAERSLTLST